MKKLFATLANQFRKFGRTPRPEITASAFSIRSAEPEGFGARTKLAGPPLKIMFPHTPPPPGAVQTRQVTQQSSEAKNVGSFGADFITRQELNRELDLLRRLVESRK
jgi:hypothetical protein